MEQKNTVLIDGQVVELNGEKNILELTRKIGIEIPTFCYHSELSLYGACRMCVVEVEGRGIMASCSTPPAPGMKILTNSPRVQRVRRTVLELLLANHDRECTTCDRNGSCKLQELANRFGVKKIRFGERDVKLPLDHSSHSLVRDPNKCILCGDCVRMCAEVQGIGVLDFSGRGSNTVVTPAFHKNLADVECVNCGQCGAVCPTGAIVVKDDTDRAWAAIHDPEKMVVVQVAPAVRVALGEEFGLPAGEIVTGKVVAALKRLGFDKVFDTSITADLTVIEETHEFITRLQKGEKMPQFTSCCPAWVKYAEHNAAEYLKNLSSCRSPQQMFGSLVKKYWAQEIGKQPEDIIVVSIMPCTAKKYEAALPQFATDGVPDVDLVLTTQELARMIREAGLVFDQLDIESFDTPFGFTTGAGVIFGATGGVAEAVLRAAHEFVTGQPIDQINFEAVRGFADRKEATVEIAGQEIKVAVVHGLANAKALLQEIKEGKADYHIIEVMACPGGCVGGAGQPISPTMETKKERAKGIYNADKLSQLRKAQDNPVVGKFYERWLAKPNSDAAHDALHTAYSNRGRISGEEIKLMTSQEPDQLDIAVCVGTCCYLNGAYDTLQKFMKLAADSELKERINLHATFCLEKCEQGPVIKVDDEIINGVTPDRVEKIFTEKICTKLK
ncbi:MAG TPA: 2Fe-2S iron-sulfur cluster binding domain-containing protein [Firmicutes bacterium]|jgi:NADH-quinone oxidoreductase subunit G|nr:2Fe-2S iron-sulfur cluster binding domain-containing protein [Bacillota bacterium]